MEEKEITIELKNPVTIIFLVILSVVFFLNLQVSLSTPIVFGDEGFHARISQWIAEKTEYPVWNPVQGTLLTRKSFSRPPLLNILEGSFLFIFGFNEFLIKVFSPFVTLLTGLAVFLLTKRLYNEKIAFIASIVTITTPSFVTYSVLFYTDTLFTFFMSMFFLLFLLFEKYGGRKYLILSGIFAGLSLMTKIPALVLFVFFVAVFLYKLIRTKKLTYLIRRYYIFVIMFFIVTTGYFLRNLYYYDAPICYGFPGTEILFKVDKCTIDNFEEKYEFGARVKQVGTEQSIFRLGLMDYLEFAYGFVWLVTFGFICGLLLVLFRKDKLDLLILFMLLALILVSYRSTSRAEDMARYTLGWVSIIALIVAQYFDRIYDFIKTYQRHIALVVFVFVLFFSYQNLTSKLTIMKTVKQFSPLFFEACDWIRQNTEKDVIISTVWSSRTVYNAQRNTTGCPADIRLSNDLDYSLEVAKKLGITHLFIQKFSIMPGSYAESYTPEFVQFLENNPDHFVKIFENGPSIQQCLQQGGCDGNILYEIKY